MNAFIDYNKPELLKYHHSACFSPVLSTWLKEIQQGNFSSWPGLTVNLFHKHSKKPMNTSLGHMHQQQKNVQYTRRQSTINITAPEPPLETLPVSTHHVHANNFNTAGKIYTDLLRRFLILPNIGNCYLFILYDYNSNATFP